MRGTKPKLWMMWGIDLFSGAGGMSVGAQWAGVDIAVAVEADQNAAATYALNHPKVKIIGRDIRSIENFSEIRPPGECVLFGGPPCQGFSTSNQRTRGTANVNNWLFEEFLRAVKQTSPDWVIFENVGGMVVTEDAIFLRHVMNGLEALGYKVTKDVVNAANFGVAQRRSRLFIIGSKCGHENLPIATVDTPTTVRQAISDLPELENGANIEEARYKCLPPSEYAAGLRGSRQTTFNHCVSKNAENVIARYPHIPEGGNWQDIPADLMGNYRDRTRCHTGIYRRLKWDEPSVVIGNFRKNMLVHPSQNRGLSVREAARLQSFPDWYRFIGSIGFQQQQVGNAVPPLLAKAVFAHTIQLGQSQRAA
jgi:DNA (cytosine-5)-methyltransferase 1